MSELKPNFATRRPLLASAAALAIAASGVFAFSMEQGLSAQAGVVEAPASVAAQRARRSPTSSRT